MRQKKIHDILLFLKRSKTLESAERYGSSMRANKNTVAEHCWRLGLMALIIGTESRVRIDINRTLSLALLHDLPEAKTGDIDAYEQILAGKKLVEEKAKQKTRPDSNSGAGFIFRWYNKAMQDYKEYNLEVIKWEVLVGYILCWLCS